MCIIQIEINAPKLLNAKLQPYNAPEESTQVIVRVPEERNKAVTMARDVFAEPQTQLRMSTNVIVRSNQR